MARNKKTILGQANSAPAQRQFTDREEPQESFVRSLAEVNNREYSILTYYGVGGIGKSSLQRHLKSAHLDQREDNVYSWVDFDLEANRAQHKALRILSQNFRSKFKIKFTAFDIAYIIYWCKAFPDHDIKKDGLPFLEEGSQLSSIVGLFEEAGGMIGTALGVLDYVVKKRQEFSFDVDVQTELKKLNSLEADQIEDQLAVFFAYDIDAYKKKNPNKKIVIFLDTYEALWQNNRSNANRLTQDEWIRNFVTELPHVLFVICGREKIRWEEDDSDWEEDLNQHILGNLSEDDAISFLNSCEITDTDIQDEMIESSEGLPYYLDLCVDTFYQIKDSMESPSAKDFAEVGKDKIFEKFMRYLSPQEQETLKVLANARFYTKELFSLLIGEFKTGYPVTAMDQLNNFSFITEEDGEYFIHDLMRISLISSQKDELKKDVNTFLFNHYNGYLEEDLNIKHHISQGIKNRAFLEDDIEQTQLIVRRNLDTKSIDVLFEAFYHKEKIGDVEALSDWYSEPFDQFFEAAKYKTILETTVRLKDLLEKELGEEHPNTATIYHQVALLHRTMGNYKDALHLSQKALAIREKVLGEDHPDTATIYNNLAIIYHITGKYEDTLPYYQKALAIREKVFGEDHPNTADSYHNLALFYKDTGKNQDALPLFQKALAIREMVLGEDHPDTAKIYYNFSVLYYNMDKHEDALLLCQKALAIHEKVLGEDHPHTAYSYNSLAIHYDDMDKYEDALPLFQKVITIREKVLGEEHPDTALSYTSLAVHYDNRNKYEDALPYYQKALATYEKIFGEDHPNTADSYHNLALFYKNMGNYKDALPLFQKALEIREKVLGEDHPDTLNSKNMVNQINI